jgi:hypothetical protein
MSSGPRNAKGFLAIGVAEGKVPELSLVGLATLDLLGDVATHAPLLLLVEDAHWLDQLGSVLQTSAATRLSNLLGSGKPSPLSDKVDGGRR